MQPGKACSPSLCVTASTVDWCWLYSVLLCNLTNFLDKLPQLPRVWMVFEMRVSVREISGS